MTSHSGTDLSGAVDFDSTDAIVTAVEEELRRFLEAKSAEFQGISTDTTDISRSLIDFTKGGKRIRPILLWWGFQLATDDASLPPHHAQGLAEAAGSLELLHAAALIHDDVIDHSDTRRGNPSLHRQFESLHSAAKYHGDGGSFGIAASIVIGDICLALSEELFENALSRLDHSVAARSLRRQLRRDVMVGQYLDILAEVIPLDDPRISDRAWEVLSYKAAKYSVEQPLLLGAALAGADEGLLAEISRLGFPLGQAFQLRDDILGICGDPAATGKPAGDDIREGKRTVLIAESIANLSTAETEVLASRLGRADLSDAEVGECVALLRDSGGIDAVEAYIDERYRTAVRVIDDWAPRLAPGSRESLLKFAHTLCYREK